MTVNEMFAWAASQSNPVGAPGTARSSVQEKAKNAFDAINNGVALSIYRRGDIGDRLRGPAPQGRPSFLYGAGEVTVSVKLAVPFFGVPVTV